MRLRNWIGGGLTSILISWSGNALSFTVTAAAGANGLRGMLPLSSTAGTLASPTMNGNSVAFTARTVKGIAYAVFPAATGSYVATYAP